MAIMIEVEIFIGTEVEFACIMQLPDCILYVGITQYCSSYLTVPAHNKQQHMYTACMLVIIKIRFYSSMIDSEIISHRII